MSKDKLEGEFMCYLRKITPTIEWLKSFKKVLLEVIKNRSGLLIHNNKLAQEKLIRLQTEKTKLIEMKKKDLLDDEDFKNEIEKVKQEISETQAIACDQPISKINLSKEIDKVCKVISGLANSYKNATYQEKLKFQSLIFTKKPTFDFTKNQTPNLSLILQNKRELASASSPIVVPRGIEPLLTG